MPVTSTSRLRREYSMYKKDPFTASEGIEASPDEDNIKNWTAVITGPKNTPYEDGIFTLKMVFSDRYPFQPPEVRFISEMFHPNVYSKEEGSNHYPDMTGIICLNIIGYEWTPRLTIRTILLSIRNLLEKPMPEALHLPKESKSTCMCIPRGNRSNQEESSIGNPANIYQFVNKDSAANPEAARLYLRNDSSFEERVKIIVDKSIEASKHLLSSNRFCK